MKLSSHPLLRAIALWIAVIAGLGVCSSLAAAGVGVVTGRVYNPATGEYVRNARIEIKDSGQTTVSGDGGEYRLTDVPVGPAVVMVSYVGYRPVEATVEVSERAAVTRDFQIFSTETDSNVVKLGEFVVSSSREGNAKAIMEQRGSMNVTNTIATDVYGDFPTGNVGEFLRYLPGVQMEGSFGEPRYVRLRGLESQYNTITVDGLPLAAADANNGANGRAFSFEMASLNVVDSIEVSKTISADVDANAPAGTINLRMKRAFDRENRRVVVTTNMAMHDSVRSLGKSPGPFPEGTSHKVRPGGSFEYSDVFFDKRLGIVLNLNESNLYEESSRVTHSINYSTTAADQRYGVMNTIALLSAPRFYERSTVSLTADFRATPNLAVGLKVIHFTSDLFTPQRTVTMTAGTRTTVGDDGLTNFTTNAKNASIAIDSDNEVSKFGKSTMLMPSFDLKVGSLTVEGRFAGTSAKSWYDPNSHGLVYNPGTVTVPANFHAERSSVLSHDWKITQVSGGDISSPASFPSGQVIIAEDGRFSTQKFYTAKLDARLPTTFGIPILWQGGLKYNYEGRSYNDESALHQYSYTGSGSYWADKVSDFPLNDGFNGCKIRSISGGQIFMPNMAAVYRDINSNPGNYRQVLTAENAYTACVANRSRYAEEIEAAYLMATMKVTSKATLRAGMRYEKTTQMPTRPDAYSSDEMKAAGYTINSSTGRASTVDGIFRQFLSRPWKETKSSYDNYFPSASIKYELAQDTDVSFGFSTTIRRAPYSYLSGVYLVNDESQNVTITNPNLQPESARNFALRFAHYTKKLGMFSLSFFENEIKERFVETTLTAEEFGNTDPTLSGYTFTTTKNSAEKTLMRGVEVEFRQNLGFISQHLSRFTLTGSFTRNYVQDQVVTKLTPHIINGGVNYTVGRFNVYTNASWTDDTYNSITSTTTRVDKSRTYVTAGGGVMLSRNLHLNLSVRNLTDSPSFVRVEQRGNLPQVLQLFESTGTTYILSLKATF